MATDEIDRAGLIAAYRVARAAPAARSERVLARLRAPTDYAVLLPDGPGATVWPVVLLAIAAAVLAVFALEAITGSVAARLGRAERYEAVDQPTDGTAAVRGAAIVAGETTAGGTARERGRPVPAELPAELPPPPLQRPSFVQPAEATVDPSTLRPAPPRSHTDTPVVPEAAPLLAPTGPERRAALLAEAREAVGRRGWVDARNALSRFRSEFPELELTPEREAYEIVVGCRLDPGEATRARGRDFLVHHGRSPYLRMVVTACRGSAPTVISPFD